MPTLRIRESPEVGTLFGFGFGACILTLLVVLIWRLMVAGSGMPGVGVAPFGSGLPIEFLSGMPGVGVPPAPVRLAFAGSGMPGVEFEVGGIGDVERPAGIFFGSIFTLPFARLELGLGALVDWQAIPDKTAAQIKTNNTFLIIRSKINLVCNLKIAVPA